MAYLPSKKFIIVALAVLLAGGGVFWFFKGKKIENNPLFPKDKSSLSANFGQGEKNWEEVLWEIASSSPGINAKIFANADSSGETGGLTKTDILARDFLANFLSLQQSGNLNQENKDKLTESFLASVVQEKLIDKYSISDLNIINDNSEEALKNYGNELARIIKKYTAMIKENELIIIERALKNESEAELQKLNTIIKLYQSGARDLLIMKTPKNMSENHLEVINSALNISQALESVKKIFKDPAQGIIGINQYFQASTKAVNVLQDISRYFASKRIFFNEDENGYIFIKQLSSRK